MSAVTQSGGDGVPATNQLEAWLNAPRLVSRKPATKVGLYGKVLIRVYCRCSILGLRIY